MKTIAFILYIIAIHAESQPYAIRDTRVYVGYTVNEIGYVCRPPDTVSINEEWITNPLNKENEPFFGYWKKKTFWVINHPEIRKIKFKNNTMTLIKWDGTELRTYYE